MSPPGACITPSRLRNSLTVSLRIGLLLSDRPFPLQTGLRRRTQRSTRSFTRVPPAPRSRGPVEARAGRPRRATARRHLASWTQNTLIPRLLCSDDLRPPASSVPRMTTDDHPRARAGSSGGAPRPPPEPNARVGCDAGRFGRPDVEAIETLALLQLAARRRGLRLVLYGATEELRDLLAWVGLDAALPCAEGSGMEPRGQAEQREQPVGIEEEADPGDSPPRDLDDLERPGLQSAAARLVLPESGRPVRLRGDQARPLAA